MFERTDPSRVLVLDDFLPNFDPDDTQGIHPNLLAVRSNYRPEGIIGDNSDVGNCPLFQVIVDNIPRACCQLGLPDLKTVATMVYLTSQADDDFMANIHWDDTCKEPWGYTFSYHWRGASGGTRFFSDMSGSEELHRVEFQPNRLCVFPARYPHTGWTQGPGSRVILSVFTVLNGETLL